MVKLVGLVTVAIGVADVLSRATLTAIIAGVIGIAGVLCLAAALRSQHD